MSFSSLYQQNFIGTLSTKKWIARSTSILNVLSRFFRGLSLLLISFYRIGLSPFFGGSCRFEPSCSVYAEQAFKSLPLLKALQLVTQRILKCRPGGPFGPDPVPKCGCHHE